MTRAGTMLPRRRGAPQPSRSFGTAANDDRPSRRGCSRRGSRAARARRPAPPRTAARPRRPRCSRRPIRRRRGRSAARSRRQCRARRGGSAGRAGRIEVVAPRCRCHRGRFTAQRGTRPRHPMSRARPTRFAGPPRDRHVRQRCPRRQLAPTHTRCVRHHRQPCCRGTCRRLERRSSAVRTRPPDVRAADLASDGVDSDTAQSSPAARASPPSHEAGSIYWTLRRAVRAGSRARPRRRPVRASPSSPHRRAPQRPPPCRREPFRPRRGWPRSPRRPPAPAPRCRNDHVQPRVGDDLRRRRHRSRSTPSTACRASAVVKVPSATSAITRATCAA